MAMTTETEWNLNGKAPGYEPGSPNPDTGTGRANPKPEMSSSQQEVPAWERVKLARHPDRPHTLDYIQRLCSDFVELHGDRLYGDDAAIVGGLGLFDGQPVMVIGHQKGRSTKENIARNFAQANPEGFRKAQRLMEHAARFRLPILT